MIYLGIDPGSRVTGYAVLESKDRSFQVLSCDVIRLAHFEEHTERLHVLFEEIRKVVKTFHPASCGIETPVYGKDPLAMLKLGRAQAACMLAVSTESIRTTEYYPKMVKKSITGRGNATKEQVALMMQNVLKVDMEHLPNDATDALAVAWCDMLMQQKVAKGLLVPKKKMHQNRSVSSWEDFIKQHPQRVKGL